MKKVFFDEEEMFAIAVFDQDTRTKTISAMQALLPELKDDPDMSALVFSAMEKLKQTDDSAFEALPLAAYRNELEEMEDEDGEAANKRAAETAGREASDSSGTKPDHNPQNDQTNEIANNQTSHHEGGTAG